MELDVKCCYCNTVSRRRAKNQKFCSNACRYRYRVKNSSIPRTCKRDSCDTVFFVPRKSDKKAYCSSSCAATVNNKKYPKRTAAKGDESFCSSCKKPVSKSSKRCLACHYKAIRERNIEEFLRGEHKSTYLSRSIRNYLIDKAGNKCQECSFDKRHPSDGRSILEIDHVNGDGSDHRPENLKVLCPNCHALTDTYRARNCGNGRRVFYKRVDRREKSVLE